MSGLVMQSTKSKPILSKRVTESGIKRLCSVDPKEITECLGRPAVTAVLFPFDSGLYALDIGAIDCAPARLSGLQLPVVQVSAVPCGQGQRVEIIGSGGPEPWFGHKGGTAIVRLPSGGGHVLLTVYAPPAQPAALPHIEIRQLDRRPSAGAVLHAVEAADEPQEIETEIVMHIERLGDCHFPGRGWVGNRGKKLRIEAFSIRPVETLCARDIEFKALGPERRQTPWVTDAKLCGTRGKSLPLTGFAVRLSAAASERFDVIYEGTFFESGTVGPNRNGELCIPPLADDPLEAINVRILPRST
jgi:hypothetical protein